MMEKMAQASNRPFTTIEPNSSIVRVPDERLYKLAEAVEAVKVTEASVDFIDIAGLVEGASEGKGLGNKFLANIAGVHSIVHVVRCFEDLTITHVEGNPDPIRDIGIIEKELIYKDLSQIEGISRRRPKGNPTETKLYQSTLDKTLSFLDSEKMALGALRILNDEERKIFDSWRLLSSKPILLVCNVDEKSVASGNRLSELVKQWSRDRRMKEEEESLKISKKMTNSLLDGNASSLNHIFNVEPIVVSAKLESELMILEDDEEKRKELFLSYGMTTSSLHSIIQSSYQLLNLITFYTAGPTEARAWPIPRGFTAKECAGEIHSDIAKGFVKAETFSYSDFISLGEKRAKELNKLRLEGPGYIAQDGDIFLFKFKGAR